MTFFFHEDDLELILNPLCEGRTGNIRVTPNELLDIGFIDDLKGTAYLDWEDIENIIVED